MVDINMLYREIGYLRTVSLTKDYQIKEMQAEIEHLRSTNEHYYCIAAAYQHEKEATAMGFDMMRQNCEALQGKYDGLMAKYLAKISRRVG